MRITTFFLLCLVVTGCSKTEQPGNSTPKLVWKAPLLNGSESFTFNPVFYKDLVIYSVQYARLDRSEKPTVVAFKKATGERVWEWKDAQKVSDAFSASWDYYIYQNIFVFSSGPRVYAIDLDTGKSLWNTQSPESGHGSIVGMDRKIYYVQAKFDKTKQTLCTADISVGIWKPVYKIERDTSIAGAITKMIVNKEGNGKSYLYFIKTLLLGFGLCNRQVLFYLD